MNEPRRHGSVPRARVAQRPALVGAAVIAVAAAAVYANSLRNAFVWDDLPLIVYNPTIRQWHDLPALLTRDLYPPGTETGYYRPLQSLTIFLGYQLWGANAAAFHALNAALHALVALGVFTLGRRFLAVPWAAVAALLFVVHPIHTEAVTYIAGAADPLSAACVVWGLVAYAWGTRRGYGLSLLAFAGALLGRETGIVFPALAVLYDVALRATPRANPLLTGAVDFRLGNRSLPLKKGGQEGFSNGSFRQIPLDPPFSKGEVDADSAGVRLSTLPVRRGTLDERFIGSRPRFLRGRIEGLPRRISTVYAGFAAIPLVYWVWRTQVLGLRASGAAVDVSLPDRALTMLKVLAAYIGLLLVPRDLHIARVVDVERTINAEVAVGLVLLVVALGATVWSYRRSPRLFFALGWFLITLAPSANIIVPLQTFMADHWLYLPSMGWCWMVGVGLETLWQRAHRDGVRIRDPLLAKGLSINSEHSQPRQGLHPWLTGAAPAGLRSQSPTDDQSGTEPRKGRHSRARGAAPGDLGAFSEGSPQENRQSTKEGVHRTRPQRPAHPSPLRIGIIAAVCIALLGYGIATTRCNAQWRDERTLFTRLARLSPQSAKVWNHLGLLDLQDHHVADAEAAFRSALAASAATAETRAGSHTGLGIVAEARGDADGAAAAYEQAIVLWPHSGAAYANLGNLAYRRGDRGAAIAAYRQSVGMAPGNATTWQNLGAALAAEGQLPEAVEALRRAVALSPDDAELRTALQHVDAALRAGQ